MEKQNKIDFFLKEIQRLSKSYQVDKKQVYAQLIKFGIPYEERTTLKEFFPTLIKENLNPKNLDVFVDERHSYFCQFKSKDCSLIYEMNPYKIYIPLKKQNIEKNIKKIFKFISSNNIPHASKLSARVRNDSLVIRVSNSNDANKIISFVNENINKQDLYEPSPFSINENNVALSADRHLSYNETVANLIYEYIEKENKDNKIASYEEFRKFVANRLFVLQNKLDLSNIIKEKNKDQDLSEMPNSVYLSNLEEITHIILLNLYDSKVSEAEMYISSTNEASHLQQMNYEYKEFDNFQKDQDLLKELIEVMIKKYGANYTKTALKEYKNERNINAITRTNNLRERVEESKSFLTYLNYTNDNYLLINNYIQEHYQANKLQDNEEIKNFKEKLLEEVCTATYFACQTPEREFCGKLQVARLLIRMQCGDYKAITRTNNARQNAIDNIKPDEVYNLVKSSIEKNGYIIEDERDLYELYANHIEFICRPQQRGRK